MKKGQLKTPGESFQERQRWRERERERSNVTVNMEKIRSGQRDGGEGRWHLLNFLLAFLGTSVILVVLVGLRGASDINAEVPPSPSLPLSGALKLTSSVYF